MEHLTAKMSCFVRAYHTQTNDDWIFRDDAALQLLGAAEYAEIAAHLTQGIAFFMPDFSGTAEEGLRRIVEQQLAPSVLGRSAFCEAQLQNEMRLGCRQYLLFAAGYDSFSLRENAAGLTVFQLDLPSLLSDRRKRMAQFGLEARTKAVDIPCDLAQGGFVQALLQKGFRREEKAFASLLGISYYLKRADFRQLLGRIAGLLSEGSALCMDYPTETEDAENRKNRTLAAAAQEEMQARYGTREMEELLAGCGFLVYEHLDAAEMTARFFQPYNEKHPQRAMQAPEGVGYLLAVKKG